MLVRYITKSPAFLVPDIKTYVQEAAGGKRKIFFSTLLYAEIRPSLLEEVGFGSVQDLVDDFEDAFEPIGPTPPILQLAARLRDHLFHNTPMHREEKNKILTVPDSIHLATCIYVRDTLGHADVVFHTLDDDTSKGYNLEKVVWAMPTSRRFANCRESFQSTTNQTCSKRERPSVRAGPWVSVSRSSR